jgi:hypothetical protein
MTDHPEPLSQAVAERDVTLAMTPAQLLLLVVGAFVLLRVIRALRGG